MKNQRSRALSSIDPRQLSGVRGGMLYPAVKLSDGTTGVLASDIYLKIGDIAGEAGGKDE